MTQKALENSPKTPLDGLSRSATVFHLPPALSSLKTRARSFPANPSLGEGVQDLSKPIIKIGVVTFTRGETAQGKAYWMGRFKVDGRDVRYRVAGDLSRDKLKEIADEWTRKSYEEKGHFRRQDQALIEEVITEALSLTNTLASTRHERATHGARFIRWLAQRYPRVKRWHELRPSMLQAYVLELEERGLAFDSIRLAIAPIKLAWRFASENWPDIRPLPRIKMPRQPRHEIDNLEPAEVQALLDWLREFAPDVWPMATLQALAGLRTLEAAAIRREDVDLQARTLAVVSTDHHKLKTPESHRIIPICDEIVEALRIAITNQKVIPQDGELFTNQNGELWTKDALMRRWRRIRKHIAAEPKEKIRSNGRKLKVQKNGIGLKRAAEVPARRLRSSFGTMASRLSLPDYLIKRYIGHVATDTFGRHYRKITLAELMMVSERMNNWRKLAESDPSWQNCGNTDFAEEAEG